MFIDSTYFVGEINIPNKTANATEVTQAITQYEKDILTALLGYKLYSLLVADLDVHYAPQTAPYIDLVNGAEFTHFFNGNNYTLKWNGLVNDDLISLIAYYVWYKYVERDVTRLYGTGVSIANTEQGWTRASAVDKLCAAWEQMRILYGRIPPEYRNRYNPFVGQTHGFFDRPILGSQLPCVFDTEPSAYNFLFANRTKYPDWIFTPQWNINQFGI